MNSIFEYLPTFLNKGNKAASIAGQETNHVSVLKNIKAKDHFAEAGGGLPAKKRSALATITNQSKNKGQELLPSKPAKVNFSIIFFSVKHA